MTQPWPDGGSKLEEAHAAIRGVLHAAGVAERAGRREEAFARYVAAAYDDAVLRLARDP